MVGYLGTGRSRLSIELSMIVKGDYVKRIALFVVGGSGRGE